MRCEKRLLIESLFFTAYLSRCIDYDKLVILMILKNAEL